MAARRPTIDRFREKIEVTEDGCWLWTAATYEGGYAQFAVVDDLSGLWRVALAHRWAYEYFVGKIPDGMHIDHTCHSEAAAAGLCQGGSNCRHRRCVNPAHLEVVTPEQNSRRSLSFASVNAAKTHCAAGHEFTPENTYIQQRSGRRAQRACRSCRSANDRRRRAERRAS